MGAVCSTGLPTWNEANELLRKQEAQRRALVVKFATSAFTRAVQDHGLAHISGSRLNRCAAYAFNSTFVNVEFDDQVACTMAFDFFRAHRFQVTRTPGQVERPAAMLPYQLRIDIPQPAAEPAAGEQQRVPEKISTARLMEPHVAVAAMQKATLARRKKVEKAAKAALARVLKNRMAQVQTAGSAGTLCVAYALDKDAVYLNFEDWTARGWAESVIRATTSYTVESVDNGPRKFSSAPCVLRVPFGAAAVAV